MSVHDQELRDRINTQAGRCHELSRLILNLDWYDTETQARRVIGWMVMEESKRQAEKKKKKNGRI